MSERYKQNAKFVALEFFQKFHLISEIFHVQSRLKNGNNLAGIFFILLWSSVWSLFFDKEAEVVELLNELSSRPKMI